MLAENIDDVSRINSESEWQQFDPWCSSSKSEYYNEARQFLLSKDLMPPGISMESLCAKWSSHVNAFTPDNPQSFYESWNGERGASNIAANIADQFNRNYLPCAMTRFLKKEFTGKLLDFGCGTAGVTLMWQKHFAPQCEVTLADVENLPRELTSWYAAYRAKTSISFTDVYLKDIADASFDAALCIHVLEHLPEPSAVFKLLASKIKPGGIVFIEAPWGGHPEHLEVSPYEWVKGGGRDTLSIDFERIGNLDIIMPVTGKLSGVYRKRM